MLNGSLTKTSSQDDVARQLYFDSAVLKSLATPGA